MDKIQTETADWTQGAAQTLATTQAQQGAHQFTFTAIDGSPMALSDLQGKVLLIVNTASQCGLTPQYKALQEIYDRYKERGLVVIGVPSDDFGGQELDSEEKVQNFTQEKFEVNFPLTIITKVKGGDKHPFYQWAEDHAGVFGAPKWNFHKYLVYRDGRFADWFASTTKPDSAKMIKAIEAALDQV